MDLIVEGIKKAFSLIFTLDAEVLGITLLSLKVSGLATLISMFLGISVGTAVALSRFPGRRIVVSLINTGMGLPPVVVGLFVTIFLWRSGPLGFLEILYTPTAIIMAQTVIAAPTVTGITLAAIQHLPVNLRLTTTAAVMETGRGNFDIAIALSVILMLLAFLVNALLTQIQQRERPR